MRGLNRRPTVCTVLGVVAAEIADKTIPDVVFAAAKEHLKRDYILRYFMKKYSLPRTDPRLLAYTYEDMLVEMVADAIEDDRIEMGVDGRPVRKTMRAGVEITKTGSPIFDAMEEEWADGVPDRKSIKPQEVFPDDNEFPDEVNFLDEIEKRMRGPNG